MLDKKLVFKTLEQSQLAGDQIPVKRTHGQDSVISMLIHEIFGGEILKTHKNKKWHYYNRIDGERVDFTRRTKPAKSAFEDIPASPEETSVYIDKADYLTFFDRFIKTFEENVGLDKFRTGLST